MSRFICILTSFFALSFFLSGCRPGPEALKENAVRSITAKNLEEYVVGSSLQNSQYVFGLDQQYRTDFEKQCQQYRIPLDKPFCEIIRSKFFDTVEVNAEMQTVQKASNPLAPDDNLFRITFSCEKKFPDGVMNFYFIFIVADTQMGRGILNWRMTVSVNGKEENTTNYRDLFAVLGCLAHHQDGLIDYYNNHKKNNSVQKTQK